MRVRACVRACVCAHAHQLTNQRRWSFFPPSKFTLHFFFLEDNIAPMLCIGESKDEYTAGLNTAVCATQLSKDLRHAKKKIIYDQTSLSKLSHCTTQHWFCKGAVWSFFEKKKYQKMKSVLHHTAL